MRTPGDRRAPRFPRSRHLRLLQAEPEVRQQLITTLPGFLKSVQLQEDVVDKLKEAGMVRAYHPPDFQLDLPSG
jgi:hypothetical protein